MIVEIVEDFYAAIELVDEVAQHAGAAHSFDRIHEPACQYVLKEVESRVGNRHAQKNDQMLSLAFDDFLLDAIKDDIVGVLREYFISFSLRATIKAQEGYLATQLHK
jgi:hypothetical protein